MSKISFRGCSNEIEEFIGRLKSERHGGSGRRVYRNGHGKIRNFGMVGGTIQVRRPRVRNSEERFEAASFPCFVDRSCGRHSAANSPANPRSRPAQKQNLKVWPSLGEHQ
jgi:hypothetical protein